MDNKPVKRTPLKRYGARRKKRDKAGLVYGKHCARIRRFPCMIGYGCSGPVQAHHVLNVGGGGEDAENTVPLCRRHHIFELHAIGRNAFERKYGVNLARAAKEYEQVLEGKR